MSLLGVDTGGTFTDFVYYSEQGIRIHKVLSTPHAPEQAIVQGIQELELALHNLKIIHGSTVATNAVLEGKGVRTAYVTNYGLRDVLLIGRQARKQLYNLTPENVASIVKRELCVETGGRLSASGEVIDELSEDELASLVKHINELKPDAIAINLLFSFLDDRFEKRIADALPKSVFISCSSDVLPEYKEYERGMTTWLNSYIGPLVQNYLQNLHTQVQPAKLSVMQSSGGTVTATQAGKKAVTMLLSGPAGGLNAVRYIGEQLKESRLLSFDMGGTSTDVALIDGDFKLTNEGSIIGLPVAVPMVDMHTIGAGGGSIAYLDQGNMLQVGPESAGASPGPVCYGKGGTGITVTDANLVLGRIPSVVRLGGSMALDESVARAAFTPFIDKLDMSCEEIAEGIIRIANEHIVQALRVISVQKGVDPRNYALTCFGGAGGLHVCDLAEIMRMRKAIVPANSGVLSAYGMLVAPVSRELSKTHIQLINDIRFEEIQSLLAELSQKGMEEMKSEDIALSNVVSTSSLDMRYRGQSYTLNIPWIDPDVTATLFNETHARRYGHSLHEPIEIVNVRLSLKASNTSLDFMPKLEKEPAKPITYVKAYAVADEIPVYRRNDLAYQQVIDIPAIVIEDVATTYVKPGWTAKVMEFGHLWLSN